LKAIEIERKFLVRDDRWRSKAGQSHFLQQAYLSRHDGTSVRVRLIDGRCGLLTIKIHTNGLAKEEYEYAIPAGEARELFQHAKGCLIEKTRYAVRHKGNNWDVDVFTGAYQGLIIAEIEMDSETDHPALPLWLGQEVTGDKRYSNRAMAIA
jgi:CYTH domain-containing protein